MTNKFHHRIPLPRVFRGAVFVLSLIVLPHALHGQDIGLPPLPDVGTHADGRMAIQQLYRSYFKLVEQGWRLDIVADSQPHGTEHALPIIALRSPRQGDALWIIAGIHGEEPAGPNAIAAAIDDLAALGERHAVVLLPLCNPHGYARNWRYLNLKVYSEDVEGQSVGDSSHLLPADRKGETRARFASSREADAVTRYIVETAVNYPPRYSIDLHEDDLIDAGYVYSQGEAGARDPLAIEAVEILGQNGIPIKMSGQTRFGETINGGIIGPVTDSSLDELMSSEQILLDGRLRPGPGAQTVLVFETPARNADLATRIDAHLAWIRRLASDSTVPDPWDIRNPMDRESKSTAEMHTVFGQGGTLSPGPDFTTLFNKRVARIAMRDGVALHTEIYSPVGQREPLPIIMERTPYGLSHDKDGYTARLRSYPALIEDGYILVFQDTRGRNASEGEYVSLGPMRDRSMPGSTDESTDAWDTIDWLINNVNLNNGRLGTLGVSYGGYLTTRALVDPHPALRAASPQASCADMFVGDDWHHNGAFRLEYSFWWISFMEQGQQLSLDGSALSEHDNYEAFLALGPLSNVNRNYFHGQAPSWNAFTAHPNNDDYWRYEMCGVLPHIQPVTVPTLNVAGWYDAEDFYGPLMIYQKYEETDKDDLNHLVIGPWYHGGWSRSRFGRRLGPVNFGSNTSEYFRSEILAPWFAFWLKDEGALDLPEVLTFRTGANRWEAHDHWPPEYGIERRNLYLWAGGRLSFEAPTDADPESRDEYISDPDNPVPYRHRPIRANGWPEWQLEDQRQADGRPDVLTYVSAPLDQDLTFSGEPIAHLFAATTGSDSDWIVKLIDVYPEEYQPEPYMGGFQFMVAGEVFRARYRNSFEQPEAVVPGAPTAYEINLRSRNHTFRAGHRIMVQVQSTWFPMIDRNPQTFVDNIYEAVEADFQKATQSIYRSAVFPSFISLPVNTQ